MIQRKTMTKFLVGAREYATLAEAQRAEFYELLELVPGMERDDELADRILANRARLVDILTTTKTSLAKARKINGGRKPRAKAKATDTQSALPLEGAKTTTVLDSICDAAVCDSGDAACDCDGTTEGAQ